MKRPSSKTLILTGLTRCHENRLHPGFLGWMTGCGLLFTLDLRSRLEVREAASNVLGRSRIPNYL